MSGYLLTAFFYPLIAGRVIKSEDSQKQKYIPPLVALTAHLIAFLPTLVEKCVQCGGSAVKAILECVALVTAISVVCTYLDNDESEVSGHIFQLGAHLTIWVCVYGIMKGTFEKV